MPIYIRNNGTTREIKEKYVRDNGATRELTYQYVRDNGATRIVFEKQQPGPIEPTIQYENWKFTLLENCNADIGINSSLEREQLFNYYESMWRIHNYNIDSTFTLVCPNYYPTVGQKMSIRFDVETINPNGYNGSLFEDLYIGDKNSEVYHNTISFPDLDGLRTEQNYDGDYDGCFEFNNITITNTHLNDFRSIGGFGITLYTWGPYTSATALEYLGIHIKIDNTTIFKF